MRLFSAILVVRLRSLWARVRGTGDTGGLTKPCRGCGDPSPHDGHLARGALTYLSRGRYRE